MSAVFRWGARIAGALLVLVGLSPFTPLIWLLVLVHAPVRWPGGARLHFWQTQALGASLAICGAIVFILTIPRTSTQRPRAQRDRRQSRVPSSPGRLRE